MSVATLTDQFLKDEINPTMILVEGYNQASINKSVTSLSNLTRLVAGAKTFAGIDKVSKNSANIKNLTHTILKDVDNTAFSDAKKTPLPVSSKKPITDNKSAQVQLKQFYNYMKDKVIGLQWNQVATAYTDGAAVVTNIMVSLGIISAGAIFGGTAAAAAGTGIVLGASVGAAAIAIMAFSLVVMSISNAIEKSSDYGDTGQPIINFRETWRTTMKTFKNVFAGREKYKELGILSKVTGFLVPFTLFMAMSFQGIWKKLFQSGGQTIGGLIFSLGDFIGPFVGSAADIGVVKHAGEFAKGYAHRAQIAGQPGASAVASALATGREKLASGDIIAATAEKRAQLRSSGGEVATTIGKILSYVVLPVICLVVVLFLFSELVDAIQIRKLHKKEEAKMKQQSYGDIV